MKGGIMKKTKMLQRTLLFFLTLIMASCGGGGGDGSSSPGDTSTVTPPSGNITGTYNLVAFTVKYSNGLTFTNKSFGSVVNRRPGIMRSIYEH
jgi:hypothetical protein